MKMNVENRLDTTALENAISSLERSLNVVQRRQGIAEEDEWETLRAGVIQNIFEKVTEFLPYAKNFFERLEKKT